MPTQTPEFAVGWGTLALINAGLAQSKNRTGLGWFLLSLLLGPIATFIIETLQMVWAPAKESSVPNLLPKGRLESANQLTLQFGQIIDE